MVPHHRGRAESQLEVSLAQPPARVDVVSSDAKLRIEAADLLESAAPKRHVAARDVLCLPVRQEHVHGSTRRVGDTVGDEPVARRRKVGTSNAGPIAVPER